MKKVYTAPEILFESFIMSTSIAAGCEGIVGNPSKGSCGVPGSMGGLNLFSASVDFGSATGCHVESEDSENDQFCYHNPTEYNNLFNSL